MENVTKALLIAAGIFMAIMILSVIVMFGNEILSYYSAKHEATILQQTTEFNNKFQVYNGQTIRGMDLLSIMNRVIDYNNYQSGMIGYEKIIIEVDLKGLQEEFKYGEESKSDTLFQKSLITNKDDENEIKKISQLSKTLVSEATGIEGLTEKKLQYMSAEISNIVDDESAADKEGYKIYRAQILKKILGREVEDDEIDKIKKATYQYHQLTKFKKAYFKCKEVSYNQENGRVNKMIFELVTEEDGTIKLK